MLKKRKEREKRGRKEREREKRKEKKGFGLHGLACLEKLAAHCAAFFAPFFSTPCFHRVKTMICATRRVHDADDMRQHHYEGLHRENNKK